MNKRYVNADKVKTLITTNVLIAQLELFLTFGVATTFLLSSLTYGISAFISFNFEATLSKDLFKYLAITLYDFFP